MKATDEPQDRIRPGVVLDDGYGNKVTVYPPGWMYILAFAMRGHQWAIDEINSGKLDNIMNEGAYI